MSVFDKIRAIEFDKNKQRIFGIKSGILWAHSSETNGIFPLAYISKPKHISQEDFDELLERIEIHVNKPKSE